jgi:hypothetical protein
MIKVLGLKHGIRSMKRIKQRQHLIRGLHKHHRQRDYSEVFGKFQRIEAMPYDAGTFTVFLKIGIGWKAGSWLPLDDSASIR